MRFYKLINILLLMACIITLSVTVSAAPGDINGNGSAVISVVATTDLHGYVYPLSYFDGTPMDLGLARVSAYVKHLRSVNPYVILVDGGDCSQGTPLAYYYNMVDTTAEYPMMKAMGAMKYDAWLPGNHEFTYGLEKLDRMIKDGNAEGVPALCANFYRQDGTNYTVPYIIKQFSINGKTIKIGIFGLTQEPILDWGDETAYKGLTFTAKIDEAKRVVPALKAAGANVVIGIIHDDISEIKALAGAVPGIDAIISGHMHLDIAGDVVKNPEGRNVLITEPAGYGLSVSQVDIAVNSNGTVEAVNTGVVKGELFPGADSSLLELMKPYQDKVLPYLDTVLGVSAGEMAGNAGKGPDKLTNLVNKVQKYAARTQLSIASPADATQFIHKGNITIKDILYAYPGDEDYVVGILLTGEQLKKWLEHSARYYKQVTNLSDPIVKDPFLDLPDKFLDVLYGAAYDIDLTQPAGSRIKNLKYNGRLIKDTDRFTVAISNTRYYNYGGYMDAIGVKRFRDPDILIYNSSKALGYGGTITNLMMRYVREQKVVVPETARNWRILRGSTSQ